jgi:2'-5' RNA ligase
MPLQYSLGFEPPRPPPSPPRQDWIPPDWTNKLLILVKPDEDAAVRIARIADELAAYLGFTGRLVRPELLHFTIHPIGLYAGVPRSIVDAVGLCANTVRMRPFTVSLNVARNFHRKSGIPLIVLCGDDGVLGLRTLHDALGAALTKTLGSARRSSFEPHMTLSYRAMRIPDTPIEPINFTIREFTLVNSLVGQGRHVTLSRWRLGD